VSDSLASRGIGTDLRRRINAINAIIAQAGPRKVASHILPYFVAVRANTVQRVSRTTHLEAALPFREES